MALLKATHLAKSYKNRKVVSDVSLSVESGQIVGLLGPNGAGKTTSFYMIVGLVARDEGTITIDGEDISILPMHSRAKMGIGYLPQEASIFRKLSVENNIMAVLETVMKSLKNSAKINWKTCWMSLIFSTFVKARGCGYLVVTSTCRNCPSTSGQSAIHFVGRTLCRC